MKSTASGNPARRIFCTLLFVLLLTTGTALAGQRDFDEGLAFGTSHGALLKNSVTRFLDEARTKGMDLPAMRAEARETESLFLEAVPAKVDWMKGTAQGSGVPYDDILLYNAIDERYVTGKIGECTTFVANGKALAAGKGSLISKNRDLGRNTISEVAMEEDGKTAEGAVYRGAYIDIPAAEETYRFVGSRSAGRWGYGQGINEFQVIVSDNDAPTRDNLAFKAGLHDNDYVRIILERARTAREGVEILTAITEKYGQAWNAIMFEIADPNEVWVVEITGYHWVARCYNDTVTARSNQFQITDDYEMAHEGLISFAVEQGWVAEGTKRINFRAVYGTDVLYPEDNDLSGRPALETIYGCKVRYDRAMELLRAHEGQLDAQTILPFTRDHYDNYTLPDGKVIDMGQVPYYSSEFCNLADLEWMVHEPENAEVPAHMYIRSICNHGFSCVTASASIMMARPDVPNELGFMLHCYEQPCLSVYVPFYVGAAKVDPDFTLPKVGGKFLTISKLAFGSWDFYHPIVREVFDPFEAHIFGEMTKMETLFMEKIQTGLDEAAVRELGYFTRQKAMRASYLADLAIEKMLEAAVGSSAWSR